MKIAVIMLGRQGFFSEGRSPFPAYGSSTGMLLYLPV